MEEDAQKAFNCMIAVGVEDNVERVDLDLFKKKINFAGLHPEVDEYLLEKFCLYAHPEIKIKESHIFRQTKEKKGKKPSKKKQSRRLTKAIAKTFGKSSLSYLRKIKFEPLSDPKDYNYHRRRGTVLIESFDFAYQIKEEFHTKPLFDNSPVYITIKNMDSYKFRSSHFAKVEQAYNDLTQRICTIYRGACSIEKEVMFPHVTIKWSSESIPLMNQIRREIMKLLLSRIYFSQAEAQIYFSDIGMQFLEDIRKEMVININNIKKDFLY